MIMHTLVVFTGLAVGTLRLEAEAPHAFLYRIGDQVTVWNVACDCHQPLMASVERKSIPGDDSVDRLGECSKCQNAAYNSR